MQNLDEIAIQKYKNFVKNPAVNWSIWYRLLKWFRYHIRITVFFCVVIFLVFALFFGEIIAPTGAKPSSVFIFS